VLFTAVLALDTVLFTAVLAGPTHQVFIVHVVRPRGLLHFRPGNTQSFTPLRRPSARPGQHLLGVVGVRACMLYVDIYIYSYRKGVPNVVERFVDWFVGRSVGSFF
jgi:hypothetical protein